MTEKAQKYLWDIIHSIEKIEAYLQHISDFHSFSNNGMVQDAIERRLTIIGEAAHKLYRYGNIYTSLRQHH